MIDLGKADLLEPMLRLPHRFVMPDALFENEWLGLGQEEKQTLRDLGLDVRTLTGPPVQRAARLRHCGGIKAGRAERRAAQ